MSAESPVTTSVADGVGVVSFNRPDKLNALNIETSRGLLAGLREMGERDDVRAVVLRGEGRAFCVGMDLDAGLVDDGEDPAKSSSDSMRITSEVTWAIRAIPQPVVAVVQGWAVGAGFAFAAAADVRFIGEKAKFSAPFLKLGLTIGDVGVSWFLPRLIGIGRAAEVFYGTQDIDAHKAVDYGLATHISDDPLAEATAYAQQLASFPSVGVQMSKQLLNASMSSPLRDHLDAEARAQVIAGLTKDTQSILKAAKKRK